MIAKGSSSKVLFATHKFPRESLNLSSGKPNIFAVSTNTATAKGVPNGIIDFPLGETCRGMRVISMRALVSMGSLWNLLVFSFSWPTSSLGELKGFYSEIVVFSDNFLGVAHEIPHHPIFDCSSSSISTGRICPSHLWSKWKLCWL